MPKSYRIRTEVGVDKYINVNLEQDWESLEILSLKILSNNIYTRFCADYGVVTGRVFVNGGFGLPNAKVSVFIPLEDTDELNPVISELYPYKTINDINEEGYRYNLLPKLPSYNGHASTGSFPNKGDVLMDESYIEVYDKYYRFTVTTNDSGDFMIFGVPTGEQTIVMDVDLSDIGCFSLSPQDLIQQGLATETQVDGARFKSSTNLRELPQIKNLIYTVNVRPFWGSEDLCQIGITRVDFDLTKQANINIQPSAIFMGSIISTTDDDALKIKCKPKNNTGNLCELVAGPGQIQGIRQTIYSDTNGLPILERWDIEQAGKVIDSDGTFLVNVPMNLDYVYTNEFGQQILSNDPSKGIPTKGKYRFKFKWQNEQGLQGSFLRADFLVPNIKEYGWTNSNNDPFINNSTSIVTYPQIPVGSITGSTVAYPPGGLIKPVTSNIESYSIYIGNNQYFGSPESIPIQPGDTITIVASPIDPQQAQDIQFTYVPQDLFDVFRSYSFSTDWDDYANAQEAIDCEDSFYEFKYNKVYTTAMFLDRYKNGIGRARHLGIKEIDNRSCKSTVNTFPVNDIIRNFDFIFFVFNILINILTFPILTLLFIAHFISFMWPLLKYVLIALGIYFTYEATVALVESIQTTIAAINIASGIISVSLAGPVVNVGNILEAVRLVLWAIGQTVIAIFKLGLALAFTAVAVVAAKRIKGFPRIGLPMIAYPDCTSCDCDCKSAEMDDDFDESSINQDINELGNAAQGGTEVLSVPKTLIAPVNYSGSYDVDHPNLTVNDDNEGPYHPCESLGTLMGDQGLVSDLAVRASLDFRRLFSGYDVISSTSQNNYIPNPQYLLKAPQPFLFTGKKLAFLLENASADQRLFAFPKSVTLSQKLNEFNTRDKYFKSTTTAPNGTGINRIKTTVNPSLGSTFYEDQVLVVLMNQGTTSSLGVGNVVTFQDPNYVNPNFSTPGNRLTNLTGATTNQFQNNAITGVTTTGNTIPYQVPYADPNSPTSFATPANIFIVSPTVSQLSVAGNNNVEQSYLQYPTDIEYFQLVTGVTYNDFIAQSNTTSAGFFPSEYLLHDIVIGVNACGVVNLTYNNVITTMTDHQNYEICIFVRGVDPHTAKQPTIQYDLSRIFGKSYGQGPIISGSYYLNRPIQPTTGTGYKPLSHNTANNTTPNLYFPSFTFTPDSTYYTGFTSNYPYYYLSTDDSISTTYNPYPGQWQTNNLSSNQIITNTNGRQLPLINQSYYMVGGTYIRWVDSQSGGQTMLLYTGNIASSPSCDQDCQNQEYFNTGSTFYTGINAAGNLTALYSPAYYRYSLGGVSFSSSANIVMRSDRLPTSSTVQNGASGTQTGFGLHQNDNFAVFTAEGAASYPYISAGADLYSGESQDDDPTIQALTETLTCEGMVPLECYSGSGSNVGVIPSSQCSIPADRMINGCYCLLNKTYLEQYPEDARLFLEWKVRFTMNFAACRGVFAQVFQNNWINGTLYMFNFNKKTTFPNGPDNPFYDHCQDVIMFNQISNTFFYRSSPWDGSDFIGKDSPTTNPNAVGANFPGFGYNKKQIQFPTTITDLGPRDYFINEICCSNGEQGFGSYYANQLKTTSYQDNSDIIQLGFLSRILNEGVRQRIIPISNGGDNSEGKGIIQFFNSTRGGYRIDGDWAQMLSINSEWKISPFITENIPGPQYIYFGDNNNGTTTYSGDEIRPIMGLFFEPVEEDIRYRKIMSPGIETFNFSPLIEEKFSYPKSQEVPNYRWAITEPDVYAGTPNIFGSENNNWYTNASSQTGFFSRKYQDLEFTAPTPKYQTTTTKVGYLANFDLNGVPDPIIPIQNILQGAPSLIPTTSSVILVGAPYHFYFGLNNGKTAIDRFYKLYVVTED